MIFSSLLFLWIFLPVVILLYCIVGEKKRNILLLAASLFFYAWGEPIYILLMLLSIFINWYMGLILDRYSGGIRKAFLLVDTVINLGILVYFKYYNFLVITLNKIFQWQLSVKQIALPIGISFFTFQAMSYIIDIYKKEYAAEKNIMNVALYISFFPQLIAGPIVKYADIREQIYHREWSADQFSIGFRRFIYGLAKKVIISNTLAQVVDEIAVIETAAVSSLMAWTAVFFYTFQIYYDFSGYSDMAIGLGNMFGFYLPENFSYPYMAKSVQEFWRRWHISLSSWFRQYVYIPLGGNRNGIWNTYRNLIIVFFLTGLWHGASWNFVLWGLFHGVFILIERMGVHRPLEKNKVISHMYLFAVVLIGWIFFRFEDMNVIIHYLTVMFFPWKQGEVIYSIHEFIGIKELFVLVAAVAGSGVIQFMAGKCSWLMRFRNSSPEIIYCGILLVVCFTLLASNTYNPFIYFKF